MTLGEFEKLFEHIVHRLYDRIQDASKYCQILQAPTRIEYGGCEAKIKITRPISLYFLAENILKELDDIMEYIPVTVYSEDSGIVIRMSCDENYRFVGV